MEFLMRTVLKVNAESITNFMRKNYYSEEIILKSFLQSKKSVLTDEEMKKIQEDIYNLTESSIIHGQTKELIDKKNNNMVGIFSCLVTGNPNFKLQEEFNYYKAFKSKSKIFADYINYVIDMADDPRIFTHYPTAKYAMEICTAVVSKDQRKNGIGYVIMKNVFELSYKNRIDVLYALCTSPISMKILENCGFRTLKEYELSKYQDSRGVSIDPKFVSGITVSVMAKRLEYPP